MAAPFKPQFKPYWQTAEYMIDFIMLHQSLELSFGLLIILLSNTIHTCNVAGDMIVHIQRQNVFALLRIQFYFTRTKSTIGLVKLWC